MEVLRVPPYPIVTTWTLPEADYEYVIYVEDLVDHSVETSTGTSDENGVLEYELPQEKVQFDRSFLIRFYDTEQVHILYESNLDIIRPYTDPNLLGTTASEIEEYKMLEMVARSIMDTYSGGFYNHKSILQVQGNGLDYMPVWRDANRVLKVYENNVLVYDIDNPENNVNNYRVTLDNSAIQRFVPDGEEYNLIDVIRPRYPIANSDVWGTTYGITYFPRGYDYIFVLDEGYRAIPPDVEYATKLLIDDLKCGRLDYAKKYIESYSTDQFKMQFNEKVFNGTGNMIVDKILEKYIKSITKVGVL